MIPGALYRSIGLYMSRCGIAPEDKAAFVNALDGLTVELGFENGEQRVYLCGEDVTGLIRTPEISMYASAVSSVPEVRAFLLETQRRLARENNVIMDGRDIGTVILPDASVKIFVTASDEVRAKRRMLELHGKGMCSRLRMFSPICAAATSLIARATSLPPLPPMMPLYSITAISTARGLLPRLFV